MSGIDYDTLDTLESQYRSWHFDFPELSDVYVPGEGDEPLAFVFGEAPGAQEEIRRRPFVGDSGRVLRDLMLTAHLSTEDWQNEETRTYGVANAWLTNVVKFRPPRNRKPYWIEIQKSRPMLRVEWKAVGKPRVIIPVGKTALQALTGKPHVSILKHSGWLHEEVSRVDGQPLYIWPMIHPSYGLRNPALQPLLEEDWRKLGDWLATHS